MSAQGGLSNAVGFLWLERSCWRVPFELQMIHRYTDMNAPLISDFTNVYHDPMTISFL
jgi:hypothetical protein